jgi:hypothetical protein
MRKTGYLPFRLARTTQSARPASKRRDSKSEVIHLSERFREVQTFSPLDLSLTPQRVWTTWSAHRRVEDDCQNFQRKMRPSPRTAGVKHLRQRCTSIL